MNSADSKVQNVICNYDIIAINETWFTDSSELSDLVPEYRCEYVNVTRKSKVRRPSGGIFTFIKNTVETLFSVTRVCHNFGFGVILKFDGKNNISYADKIKMFFACIQPECLTSYENEIEENGINILKEKIIELKALYPMYSVINER